MKGLRIRIRLKIYPVLWSGIILASVYLLVRFAGLSLSEDIGQASLRDIIADKLCEEVLNAGPSLVSFSAGKEGDGSLLTGFIDNRFALQGFMKDETRDTAYAQGYASVFDDYAKMYPESGPDMTRSDIDIVDSEEADSEDSETRDSETRDSETKDSETKDSETKDSETKDSENKDYQLIDSETKGLETIYSDSTDSEIIDSDSKDSEAVEAGNMTAFLHLDDTVSEYLGLEYILTNGEIIRSEAAGRLIWDDDLSEEQLKIGYLAGEVSPAPAENSSADEETEAAALSPGRVVEFTLDQLQDTNFLVRNFYFVDGSTAVTDSLFNAEKLLGMDMTMKQANDAPQILIYHTHSQEAYADSSKGAEEDTVVGMGSYLANILSQEYGYNVIHDTTYYDVIGAKGYDESYTQAFNGLTKILEDNPTIEVMIDLHRNSGAEKITMVDGEETAQIMLFNGLCRDQNGPITNLDNPYLQDNLAFSLQLQMKSLGLYPGLFRKNYLKCWRYNMHFRPKSLLVELGTYKNTVQSAKNALEPFARILDSVLKGD